LRRDLRFRRAGRYVRLGFAIALAGTLALAPRPVAAQGLFDFLFGGLTKQRQAPPQANFFADPFGTNPQPAPPPRPAYAGSGPAFCVRSCDGRYFPLMRGSISPAQMCQAFCPASPTRIYFGSSIDGATASNGERYADSDNAFAFRKELRADCTCNGRSPAGLAQTDLSLDSSLRPGDVIATTDGLVAYSGGKTGGGQPAEFKPIASYPGLTAEVRARLNEMKVAPVAAEMIASDAALPDVARDVAPVSGVPRSGAKRADVD
jgi:Protein of unknown function (DUF2865)